MHMNDRILPECKKLPPTVISHLSLFFHRCQECSGSSRARIAHMVLCVYVSIASSPMHIKQGKQISGTNNRS